MGEMPLYKIVKMWFIPPGVYIVIFLILAIYLLFCARRSRLFSKGLAVSLACAGMVCFVMSLVTCIISTNAGAQRLMHSLEYKYARRDIQPDAIFVLASGTDRINAGIALQKKYKVDVVLSGYQGSAAHMQKIMLQKGVPVEHTILEPEATNTKDHAKFILPIAIERGYRQVYLVTSAYHMPRSMLNFEEPFREAGITVVPYPCGYTVPKEHRTNAKYELLPNIQSFEQGTKAWHEYLGMLDVLLGI